MVRRALKGGGGGGHQRVLFLSLRIENRNLESKQSLLFHDFQNNKKAM